MPRESSDPTYSDDKAKQKLSPLRRAARGAIASASWMYLIAIGACWATIRFANDQWWPALLLELGPRWICSIPLIVLLPAAALICRRSLVTLLLAGVIAIWPVTGFCMPWQRALPPSSEHAPRLLVMTCNIHGRAADQKLLFDLISLERPDIVAIEECEGSFRRTAANGGANDLTHWYVANEGELHIESRYPIRKVRNALGTREWAGGMAVLWEIQTPEKLFPLVVAHLISPHKVIDDVMHVRPFSTEQAQLNSAQRQEQAAVLGQLAGTLGAWTIYAGDFNTTSDTAVFTNSFAGLSDCFSSGAGFGFGWTYRTHWTTTRVDHVLAGSGWVCRRCWVGPDIGSPHRPLFAELQAAAPR